MGTIIVMVVLIIVVVFAIFSSLKHMKGEGGCCGGGSEVKEYKKLDAPKLGEKLVVIEGMHCDHCKNSVEHAVNKIDGAVCKVNLKKNIAKVSYSKEIPEDEIKKAIEQVGFHVTKIEQI